MKKRVFAFSLVLCFLFSVFAFGVSADGSFGVVDRDLFNDLIETQTLNENLQREYAHLTTPVLLDYHDSPSDLNYRKVATLSFRNSISSAIVQGVPVSNNPFSMTLDSGPFYGASYNASQGVGALVLGSKFIQWDRYSIYCQNQEQLTTSTVIRRGTPYCFSFAITANSEFFTEEQNYDNYGTNPLVWFTPTVSVRIGSETWLLPPNYAERYNGIMYYHFEVFFYYPNVSQEYLDATSGVDMYDVIGDVLYLNSFGVSGIFNDTVTTWDSSVNGGSYAHAMQFMDFTFYQAPDNQTLYTIPSANDFSLGNYDQLSDALSNRLTNPANLLAQDTSLLSTMSWISAKVNILLGNTVPELGRVVLFSLLLGLFSIIFGIAKSASSSRLSERPPRSEGENWIFTDPQLPRYKGR